MPLIKSLKDKNKKKQNHQQKHQTDINRNSGQNLMDALKNVEIGMSGIENPEGRRVFRSITQTFIKYVDNTPAIGQYDVTEMDAILLGMIEIYGQALKEGDLDTAKRGVEYIQTVLLEYRKELNTLETARKADVLTERTEMMNKYKAVLKISHSVFVNKCNVEEKQKEYQALFGEYKELFEKVKKQKIERPAIYESLLSLRPGIDKIPNNAQEMNRDLTNLRLMAAQKEDLTSDMNLYYQEYNAQLSTLKDMETKLSSKNGILSKEEEQQIHAVIEEYRDRLQQISMEIETLIGIQKKRHAYVEEVMSSMAFGKEAMENVRAFEELLREEELEQEDVARGMENQQEIENENAQMYSN